MKTIVTTWQRVRTHHTLTPAGVTQGDFKGQERNVQVGIKQLRWRFKSQIRINCLLLYHLLS